MTYQATNSVVIREEEPPHTSHNGARKISFNNSRKYNYKIKVKYRKELSLLKGCLKSNPYTRYKRVKEREGEREREKVKEKEEEEERGRVGVVSRE